MKIILYPRHVVSLADGDKHYVSAPELIRLYGLDPNDTRILVAERPGYLRGYRPTQEDVHLHPRADGKYPRPV